MTLNIAYLALPRIAMFMSLPKASLKELGNTLRSDSRAQKAVDE